MRAVPIRVLAGFLLMSSCLAYAGESARLMTSVQPLGKIPERSDASFVIVSPDGSRMAAIVPEKKGVGATLGDIFTFTQKTVERRVFVDGATSEPYGGVCCLTFSNDGREFAYIAAHGSMRAYVGPTDVHPVSGGFGPFFVVHNGKQGDAYNGISEIVFSPDGAHLAHNAFRENVGWFVVVDGNPLSGTYGQVGYITYSPNGKRMAFLAWNDEGYFMVLDGERSETFDKQVGPPVFSPDSKRVAHTATDASGRMFMVIDGKRQAAHDRVSDYAVFSPDSRSVAYWALDEDRGTVIVDGESVGEFDAVFVRGGWRYPQLVFGVDENQFGYISYEKEGSVLVVGNQETRYPDSVLFGLSFAPGVGRMGFGRIVDKKIRIVIGDEEVDTGNRTFSAWIDSLWEILPMVGPQFSPDGKHVAMIRNVNPKCRVYESSKKCSKSHVVDIDGATSEPFTRVLRMKWLDKNTVRATVLRDDEVLGLTLTAPALQEAEDTGETDQPFDSGALRSK